MFSCVGGERISPGDYTAREVGVKVTPRGYRSVREPVLEAVREAVREGLGGIG